MHLMRQKRQDFSCLEREDLTPLTSHLPEVGFPPKGNPREERQVVMLRMEAEHRNVAVAGNHKTTAHECNFHDFSPVLNRVDFERYKTIIQKSGF